MTYGYIRVSTDKQTVENQRYEINRFCSANGLRIDRWIEETASGTIPWERRRLGRLLRRAHPKDLLLCSELSRLGRSLFMILEVLNHCLRRDIRVWTVKDGYRLGDDIPSKVLAFALALSAEIERDLISQRTREALARRRSEGRTLGRDPGPRALRKLAPHAHAITRMLAEGRPKTRVARALHVDVSTLRRFLKRTGGL